MVKFLDLQSQYHSIKNEIDEAIQRIVSNASFIGGEAVQQFEQNFASYQQAKHCVGVGNGTDALEIAIEALDLPPQSEIIVPANSFIASSEAVTRSGHRVVFCDCDPHNYTLSLASLETKINTKTKAVIAVHLYGHPCDMSGLRKIADKHGLSIIEDCAQAHGAKFEGKRVGALGDIGTFSFYPGKVLGAYGDGGAIITNNESLAKKAKMIANHGRLAKYDHEFEGRNSRLDTLQAAILDVKLSHLDSWLEKRNACADFYYQNLAECDSIVLPASEKNIYHAYHLFVIRHQQRDALQAALKEKGIQTGVHYPIALPKLEAYNYLPLDSSLKALSLDSVLLSLPIGEHLEQSDLAKVCEALYELA